MTNNAVNKVLYNVDQTADTSAAEKAQARSNIGAQAQLTAGTNITIDSDNVISAAGGATYTAGANINIDANNVISATDTTYNVFTSSTDGLAPKANGTDDGAKFLRGDGTWQYPMTGDNGDTNHPNIIIQGSNGILTYTRAKRLFWEFAYNDPTVELTAADISNGYMEFRFVLGTDGMEIAYNGNMICMKGYGIQMGNSLNGKQMSFYIDSHSNPGSPRMLMDTGFETYTESVVSGYSWKAFKAIGLCADNNVSKFDAVLRVPLTTEQAGDTFALNGNVKVSVFGVAGNDS